MQKVAPALLVSALLACGGARQAQPVMSAPAASEPRPSTDDRPPTTDDRPPMSRTVAAEETLTLASGASFKVPVGWTIDAANTFVVLEPPERDLRVVIGDVPAISADDAVAKLWEAFSPGFSRPVDLAEPRPGRRGWDERKSYVFLTSPNERRVVTAVALRRAWQWTVLALDGEVGAFERRIGQIQLVGESLRPAGYTPESFAGKQARTLDPVAIAKIIGVVEQARIAADVPGVALALVQNGKVVHAGGLGVRTLGKPAKVDEHTLFMIASTTKPLTTFAMAKLVDEGRFGWDTPVTQLYPKFMLGNRDVTRELKMKHLVCACTGLPRQDLEWLLEFDKQTPAGVMRLLGTVQPTSKIGEVFQYSNLMAAAAGYIAGSAAFPRSELGPGYDTLMQTRVFGPLGMLHTTFDFTRALAGNHATPHGIDIDGKTRKAELDLDYASESVRPAGGAWSSVNDLARYVLLELAHGVLPDGQRYIGEAALTARQIPQIRLGEHGSYGMGLFVENETGAVVVRHGGDLVGYHSDMFWLPEHGVGGIILTNGDSGVVLRRAFLRRTLEVLFDGRDEAAEDVLTAIRQFKDRTAQQRPRLLTPPDPAASGMLAAHYMSKELGTINVRKSAKEVIFDFGEFKSHVASRKNDDGSFSFITIDPGQDGFELIASERNGGSVLIMRDAQHEYVFEKK